MKRIIAIFKRKFDSETSKEFVSYFNDFGVNWVFCDRPAYAKSPNVAGNEVFSDKPSDCSGIDELSDKETLIVTDRPDIYRFLKQNGLDALIAIDSPDETDWFGGARYFAMNIEDTDYDYFYKVWQRIHKLPWLIKQTQRLIIRETCEEDVAALCEIYKDESITRYTEKAFKDASAEAEYVAEYRKMVYEVCGYGIWTVKLHDNSVIGRCGLISREGFDGVELGIVIGTGYQHMGYAKEAVQATLEFAVENNLFPVCALVMRENAGGNALMKSFGFVPGESVILNGAEYVRLVLVR